MKRLLFLACCAAGIGAILALGWSAVSAHSRPIRLDPPPGAVLESAPSQVTGWFTADLRRDPNWNFIHVTDAEGNRVDTGEAELSANRRQMIVQLRAGLGAGRYVVTWRTWDEADAAIFGDCYTFFVGQAAADQAIAENFRLDGGRNCERIDVSSRNGTPVPGQTPTAVATEAAGGESHTEGEEPEEAASDDGGGDVPAWSLVAGVLGGLAVGAVGARVVGRS
jgi:methionine-rich copper-binding protein CopC